MTLADRRTQLEAALRQTEITVAEAVARREQLRGALALLADLEQETDAAALPAPMAE